MEESQHAYLYLMFQPTIISPDFISFFALLPTSYVSMLAMLAIAPADVTEEICFLKSEVPMRPHPDAATASSPTCLLHGSQKSFVHWRCF